MTYAIVRLGGKQYRVQEGERLLVDRLAVGESKSFHPEVLFLGGNGQADLAPKGVEVTARVVEHVLGHKVRIGKYRPKKGYKRHTGFRARLSQIEIEAIRKKASRVAKPEEAADEKPKPAAKSKPAAVEPRRKAAPKPQSTSKPKPSAKPKAEAKRKPPARKPAAEAE